MASMRGKRVKNLRNHFTMLEMTNGLYMWEMTYIFWNWLKCLRNG